MEADAPGIANDNGSDTDEFISDGGTRGVGQPCVFQGGAPDVVEEHVGERTKHEAKLVGPPVVATCAISVEIELLFLDPIFHVAACAVDFVVELLGIAFKRGEDEASVCSQTRVLCFDDDAPFAIPCGCGILEPAEKSLLVAGLFVGGLRLPDELGSKLFATGVSADAADVFEPVRLTPAKHLPAAEAAVATENDLHLRPGLPHTLGQ